MYPLMVDSSISKLIYLLLGNRMPAGYTKFLPQVGLKFRIVFNNYHISNTYFLSGLKYKWRCKNSKQHDITKPLVNTDLTFLQKMPGSKLL
jgi:hypothetical protein